jgi:hypothetical protein
MTLVGVGTAAVSIALSCGLVLLGGAGGEVVALGFLLIAAGSLVMTLVIRHYGALRQRREREAKLLR